MTMIKTSKVKTSKKDIQQIQKEDAEVLMSFSNFSHQQMHKNKIFEENIDINFKGDTKKNPNGSNNCSDEKEKSNTAVHSLKRKFESNTNLKKDSTINEVKFKSNTNTNSQDECFITKPEEPSLFISFMSKYKNATNLSVKRSSIHVSIAYHIYHHQANLLKNNNSSISRYSVDPTLPSHLLKDKIKFKKAANMYSLYYHHLNNHTNTNNNDHFHKSQIPYLQSSMNVLNANAVDTMYSHPFLACPNSRDFVFPPHFSNMNPIPNGNISCLP